MTDGRVEMSDNNVSSQDQLYRVKFQTGQERTMKLSIAAVKYYQNIGVQVTPISQDTQLTDVSIRMRNIEANQMQIGKDLTALGKIDVRQDATIAQYRTEFDTAKLQRDSNAAKIEQIFSEHQNIYDSIGQKADKSHTHAKDGSVDCGLFGLGCAFDDLTSKVGTYALIAGAGIIGFLILRSKI
jgi:hypothetical protein